MKSLEAPARAKAARPRPQAAPTPVVAPPSNAAAIEQLQQSRPKAPSGKKPTAPARGSGITLPGTTVELMESTSLSVKSTGTYTGAKNMPAHIAAMLMEGVRREGVSDARTLEAILEDYIDEGTVEVFSISSAAGGGMDTWLRFTCGDTEVGYIYSGKTLKAIVGDQDINPV